jgi:hypothetical protein
MIGVSLNSHEGGVLEYDVGHRTISVSVRIEGWSQIGSKLENLFFRRICSSFSKASRGERWTENAGSGRS